MWVPEFWVGVASTILAIFVLIVLAGFVAGIVDQWREISEREKEEVDSD